MNEREFYREVQNKVLAFMPAEYTDSTAMINEVTKPGDIKLHGLSFHKGEVSAAPVLYLEDYYGMTKEGWPMDMVLKAIAKSYSDINKNVPSFGAPDLEYGKIKNDLRVKLIYAKNNNELLSNLFSVDVGCGYVLTVYVDLGKTLFDGATVAIRKDMVEKYGYDEHRLILDAIKGSVEHAPARLTHIEDELFSSAIGKEPDDLLSKGPDHLAEGILVLTTSDKYYGAAALYYPGIQDRIAELVHGSYFILPSSVHELLVCPDDGIHNAKDLAEMVRFVNGTEVAKDEQLGNRVLYFDAQAGKLDVAFDMDSRQKERGEDRVV